MHLSPRRRGHRVNLSEERRTSVRLRRDTSRDTNPGRSGGLQQLLVSREIVKALVEGCAGPKREFLNQRVLGSSPRRTRPDQHLPGAICASVLFSTAQIRLIPIGSYTIDMRDDQREGRSSSAAKRAGANFEIAFARLDSRNRYHTSPCTGIDLGLPPPQRLRIDTQLISDPPTRALPAATRRSPRLQHQPQRPLPQLLRALPRCHHLPSLGMTASIKPGTRQFESSVAVADGQPLVTSGHQIRGDTSTPHTRIPASPYSIALAVPGCGERA